MNEGYITIPMMVLEGWVGQNERYLKWWTQLRREASWTAKTIWYNRQQVYLQPRQVLVTVNSLVKQWGVCYGQLAGKAVGRKQTDGYQVLATTRNRQTH